ncbi:alkylation response protein AidB-like acyl-CoA dehydrogenase [Nocardioides albertanoniae]|uniref:Alkylation response protein AidB-like acyl-CoA dehydrogenase n=2 Tax=Nocardioides albertanoniae TaxID=1175486 RepID=A0A543A880_9ACTN|nr:alkylation response protein AidB-like acyl-CoA dehydrogenase [Nocardioides albertanoniae]
MLDTLAADRESEISDDDPAEVARLRQQLAELGVWTMGVREEHGGGGADVATLGVAWERLGRHWPSLGWASAQAHAALDLIGGEEDAEGVELCAGLHAGTATIAVVDAAAAHVDLEQRDRRLIGTVDRVDTTAADPALLVLDGSDRALLIPVSGTTTTAIRRTGLAGAQTRTVIVDVAIDDVLQIDAAPVASARCRLMHGAAAVAAGIAGRATDDAADYAGTRVQFGGPLTAIPTVRGSLFDQAAGASVLDTLAVAATDDVVTATGAARHACAQAIEVATAALQSHGGYGYLTEYPVEHHLRDAISLRAATNVDGAATRAAGVLVGRPSNPTLVKEAS